jgi:hypothetical protein
MADIVLITEEMAMFIDAIPDGADIEAVLLAMQAEFKLSELAAEGVYFTLMELFDGITVTLH